MATKKVNKATFSYGGVELSLTKSNTQAAVQYTPSLKAPVTKRASRSATAPPQQIESFEMVSSRGSIGNKLDELRARPWHNCGNLTGPVFDNIGGICGRSLRLQQSVFGELL